MTELCDHPGKCDVADVGVWVAAADAGVDAWEPCLFESFEDRLGVGSWGFPDGGFEWRADFVKGEGLIGVFDVGCYLGIDEAELLGRVFVDGDDAEELDCGNTKGTDCVPDSDGFDGNVGTSEFALEWKLAVVANRNR